MTKILPLLAALLTMGALATPVLAQDSDQEDEAQMDEEAAEASADEEAPADEEAEQSEGADSVADEPETEAAEEESGDESEAAEVQAAAEPDASSAEPKVSARGVADGAWSGGISTAMGYKSLQLTIEDSSAATVTGDFGESKVETLVGGNEVSWSWSVVVPMPMKIQCSGTIEGNTLNGICHVGSFGDAPVQRTRN